MGAVVWDSEALNSKDDREAWPEFRERAGICVACVIDTETGLPEFFSATDDGFFSIEALACALEAAPLVISYNGQGYDNIALSAILRRKLRLRQELDLWASLKEALDGEQWPRGSWKLDRVAKDILGVGKSEEDGAFAPSLWADRRYGKLFTYVYRDVWLTWKVWEFGRENGFVLDPLGGKVEVRW